MNEIERYEKDQALRALFTGLCQYWGLDVRGPEDPKDPSDFSINGQVQIYVFISADPADRREEIAEMRGYGNHVLVVDEKDVNQLRLAVGSTAAINIIAGWTTRGTHASWERQRLGITS
jgi:hypothetical protein